MTTTDDFMELEALRNRIDQKLSVNEQVIQSHIIKFDFLSGYKNGLNMIRSAADNGTYNDKKPETMERLKQQLKTRIEIFKDNINNAAVYPLQTEQSKENARGQIAGIAGASKILFKYDALKELGENIEYFKYAQMPTVENEVSQVKHKR